MYIKTKFKYYAVCTGLGNSFVTVLAKKSTNSSPCITNKKKDIVVYFIAKIELKSTSGISQGINKLVSCV